MANGNILKGALLAVGASTPNRLVVNVLYPIEELKNFEGYASLASPGPDGVENFYAEGRGPNHYELVGAAFEQHDEAWFLRVWWKEKADKSAGEK